MSETGAKDSEWGSPSAGPSHDRSAGTSASHAPGRTEVPSKYWSASVLVVEDDRGARRAIGSILRMQGFAVSEAGTLAEAHESLPESPGWILLDLMLPDGSGTDLLRTVRSGRPPHRVCVISGCGPAALYEARRLGADHVFTKPLDVRRLLDLLCTNY